MYILCIIFLYYILYYIYFIYDILYPYMRGRYISRYTCLSFCSPHTHMNVFKSKCKL